MWNRFALPVLAVGLAGIAFAIIIVSRNSSSRFETLRSEIALVREQANALEQRMIERGSAVVEPAERDGAGARALRLLAGQAQSLEYAQTQFSQITQRLDRLEQAAARTATQVAPAPALDATQVAALKQAAIDPQQPVPQRLQALRNLRRLDARSMDVVQAMIDLALSSPDGAVRADIWRNLSGVTEPALKEPLLRSLFGDPDAKVREEAAETLKDFTDADIRAALVTAAENDSDPRVRQEATKSLLRIP